MTKKNQPAAPRKQERPSKKQDMEAEIIAHRRTCDAEGTGLSHYVLMDKQVKQ